MRTYDFNNLHSDATIVRQLDPIVVEKPRNPIHIHTYGGETRFFKALTEGRLLATKADPNGDSAGTFFLPPRVYDPDTLELAEWIDVTDIAMEKAKIHTHITVHHPGAFNRVPFPCHLISVEIEGCSTIMMSYLLDGEPEIGLPIEPRFNTTNPTYSILDLHWVPKK